MSKPVGSWGLAERKKGDPADIFAFLPDLIYPENLYCACCGDMIDRRKSIHGLCTGCIGKITWVSDNPYESSMDDFSFDRLHVCCIYGYLPRQIVHRFKFKGARYLAKPLAKLIAERVLADFGNDIEKLRASYDCVSFIPSSEKREKSRGYNQSRLLALYTAKELGLPVYRLLIKPKETPSARTAGRQERRSILAGAFLWDPGKDGLPGDRLARLFGAKKKEAPSGASAVSFRKLRVLITDDVLTTGSTASEAAKTLKEAGCLKVGVAVFASGNGSRA